jgi:hypothetical protein
VSRNNLPYEKCNNLARRKHCQIDGMFVNTWPLKRNTANLYTHHQEYNVSTQAIKAGIIDPWRFQNPSGNKPLVKKSIPFTNPAEITSNILGKKISKKSCDHRS